jgi:phage terminase small subunit
MATQLRSKKSTVSNQVRTYASVAATLPDPATILDEAEAIKFEAIIRSRETDTWSEHDIGLATSLAQVEVQFQLAMAELKQTGFTILNPRGTPIGNPVATTLSQLGSSMRALTATLGLAASQRGLSNESQRGRNRAERAARETIRRASTCDLLA